MRYLLLLLASLCAFSAEPEMRFPTGQDAPAWAKELSKKLEAAWGDTAPWRKLEKKGDKENAFATMRHKSEEEYKEAYENALDNFSKTANLTKLPNVSVGSNEYIDYQTGVALLKRRNAPGWKNRTGEEWSPKDDFFIAYAQLNRNPLAYAFLFGSANRKAHGL